MRFLVRSWEYRRPRLWVGVRFACGIFNVALGVLLLASVHWLGPLAWLAVLPLAGAALIFWTVYRLQSQRPELAWQHLPGAGRSALGPLGESFRSQAGGS